MSWPFSVSWAAAGAACFTDPDRRPGHCLLGWLCGTLLSHVGMMILGNHLTEDFSYDFQAWVLLKEEWYLFFISLGLGAVAALVPAWKAANTDINQTLGEK